MPVVSSDYWNGYLGSRDSFGVEVLRTLAGNMADILQQAAPGEMPFIP